MSTRQAVRRATTESGGVVRLPGFGGGLGRDRGALLAQGGTNALPNPSVETDLTGIVKRNAGANDFQRTTEHAFAGDYSVVQELGAGDSATAPGGYFSVTSIAAAGATWTGSAYLMVDYAAAGDARPFCALWDNVSGFTFGNPISATEFGDDSRSIATKTFHASSTDRRFYVWRLGDGGGNGSPGQHVFGDAFQFENRAFATPYFDGSFPGCSWAATEHASASTRTAARLALGELPFDPENFSVMTWARMGWPSNAIAASNPVFFSLGTTPDWRYLSFDSGGRWSIGSTDNGVSFPETRTAPDAFSRGDIKAVYAGVDATTQEVKANGLAKVGAARTTSPDLADAVPDAGSCLGIANWCNSVILAQAYFNRRLTDDEIAYFENIDHVPYLGERVGEDMVAVLRGFEEAA